MAHRGSGSDVEWRWSLVIVDHTGSTTVINHYISLDCSMLLAMISGTFGLYIWQSSNTQTTFVPPILQATLAQQHAMCTVGPSLPNANPEDTESIKPMTFTTSVRADNVSSAKSRDPYQLIIYKMNMKEWKKNSTIARWFFCDLQNGLEIHNQPSLPMTSAWLRFAWSLALLTRSPSHCHSGAEHLSWQSRPESFSLPQQALREETCKSSGP